MNRRPAAFRVVSHPDCGIPSTIEGVPITRHRHCACAVGLEKGNVWCSKAYTNYPISMREPVTTLVACVQYRTTFEDVRYHFEFLGTTLRGFEPGSLAQQTHHFTTTPHIPRFLSALFRYVIHSDLGPQGDLVPIPYLARMSDLVPTSRTPRNDQPTETKD